MSDPIPRINYTTCERTVLNFWGCPRSSKRKNGLDSNIKAVTIEGLKHYFSSVFSVFRGIERGFGLETGQQSIDELSILVKRTYPPVHIANIWRCLLPNICLLEQREGLSPFHQRPIRYYSMLYWIIYSVTSSSMGLYGFIPNKEVQILCSTLLSKMSTARPRRAGCKKRGFWGWSWSVWWTSRRLMRSNRCWKDPWRWVIASKPDSMNPKPMNGHTPF